MSTIRKKALKSGANSYTAQIVRRKFDYTESRTFDTRPKAERWMKKREKEIDLDIEQGQKPIPRSVRATTLAQAIDKYIDASRKEIGKTKEQVLRTIKEYDLADMECERIGSQEIIRFAQELHARANLSSPSTVGNYLSHLSAVFKVMRPMYGIQLDEQAMRDAQTVCKTMGIIAKSEKRERRPSMGELDALMTHFQAKSLARPKSCPILRRIGVDVVAISEAETGSYREVCAYFGYKNADGGLDTKQGAREGHPQAAKDRIYCVPADEMLKISGGMAKAKNLASELKKQGHLIAQSKNNNQWETIPGIGGIKHYRVSGEFFHSESEPSAVDAASEGGGADLGIAAE